MSQLPAEDERQIAATLVRYATGIDSRDWALFRTCFAEDLHADYGDYGVWKSAEEITNAMEEMHSAVGATLHRLTNMVVSAVDGGARARTYVDAILCSFEAGGATHQACGYYDDQLQKSSGGWKIISRKYTAVHFS
jgi:SnoaL-like protein